MDQNLDSRFLFFFLALCRLLAKLIASFLFVRNGLIERDETLTNILMCGRFYPLSFLTFVTVLILGMWDPKYPPLLIRQAIIIYFSIALLIRLNTLRSLRES